MDETSLARVIALKLADHFLVLAVATMAIFLGYRLFALLPIERDPFGMIHPLSLKATWPRIVPGAVLVAFGIGMIIWYVGWQLC